MNASARNIKSILISKLKEENAFWSYKSENVNALNMPDDQLIALTMRYLDLPEIEKLFEIFPYGKVKSAWQRILVPEGEYLYTLNRFFAWYYFKSKKPDSYVRGLATRHYNRLINLLQ